MPKSKSFNMKITGMKREFQTAESMKAQYEKCTSAKYTIYDWPTMAEIYNSALRDNDAELLKQLDHTFGFYTEHLERQLADCQRRLAELRLKQ